jgi:hypothetical protein
MHAAPGQPGAIPASAVLSEGEELTYNVRYGLFDLGQVRIRTAAKVDSAEYAGYFTRALIDSYKHIPFVKLNAIYESIVDTGMFSRHFVARLKQDDTWNYTRYRMEYDNSRALIEKGPREGVVDKRDTLQINTRYQDGLSLFFYARDQLFAGRRIRIPSIVNEEKVSTVIDFKNRREAVEIEGVDYPIDAIFFEGTAEFVGIFGLTGDFTGWFSNDEARVPIMARMKVILGSITVELLSWKRSGWVPPRAPGR